MNRSTAVLTLSIVTLSPIIAGPTLPKYKVVRPENCSIWPGPHTVHGAGLQVHQDSPGDVLPTTGLIVVDINPLQL